MTDFVDLDRQFRDLTKEELEDPQLVINWEYSERSPYIAWAELLSHDRVILLAEAGSGKTSEMRHQVNRLVEEDRFAFLLALESLDSESVADLLSPEEKRSFEKWKSNNDATAWFFLDAVDELKLYGGKLDRALRRLSNDIDGQMHRARVIISSRPSDWRSGVDLNFVRNRLPIRVMSRDSSPQLPDDVFVQALRNFQAGGESNIPRKEQSSGIDEIKSVALVPMNMTKIRRFAAQSGVKNSGEFIREISRENAWIFAGRPLDLNDLIATWRESGQLGTRAEQHETNVRVKLKDDPDRPDYGVLADTQAREGLERVALALTLTRTGMIRSPEQSLGDLSGDRVLDAAEVLPDWTEAQRKALLRRAPFDPATYGRVRFHHGSVQEFLAARRLRELRNKGMSVAALHRLIFSESYGVRVVIPSMRAIAAWLALWDDDVRAGLIEREPEILLSLGDPGSLPPRSRARLIRAFVSEYGDGGWRGLNVPINEVRRLSHPDLGPVIRECWGEGPRNKDVRALLIEMIWQGRVENCTDLVVPVARNAVVGSYERIVAVRALKACGRNSDLRTLADEMLAHPKSWPKRIVRGVAADLFPGIITVDELVMLMERMPESTRTVGGFEWTSKKIVEAIDPESETSRDLRDKMAELIWGGRDRSGSHYHLRSQFGHLVPALAILCDKQLAAGWNGNTSDLVRASVIASRFGGGGSYEQVRRLRARFCLNEAPRADAFWTELSFMDEVEPTAEHWLRCHRACQGGLINQFSDNDREWLENALEDERRPERRPVALCVLVDLWRQGEGETSELDNIHKILKGDTSLGQVLESQTAPPKPDEKLEARKKRRQERRREWDTDEAERLANWTNWRDELLENPADAFSSENLNETISNLHFWLRAYKYERNSFDIWDKEALTLVFGADIADRTEKALQTRWRATKPVLWSARSPEARGETPPYEWIYGLMGVSSAACEEGWTNSLSPRDAKIAATLATIELNGFSAFIEDLAESHPTEVSAVIGGEITAELGVGGEFDHLPSLQNLMHADVRVRRLLIPRLIELLQSWPAAHSDEEGPRWAHHLDQVVRILNVAEKMEDRDLIARECRKRLDVDLGGALSVQWLKGLFRFDAVAGTQCLINSLSDPDKKETRARAIEWFATIFGNRDAVALQFRDSNQRADALGQLVLLHADSFGC